MKNLVSQRLGWNRNASSSATGCMRLAGLLAAAASASYVPTVAAQGENLILEEIVVTVRRRVEMEQDVPISMKAMDSDFIRKQNITDLTDLGTKVPAVRISDNGTSANEPIIAIRGQRPSETLLGIDQASPIYVNEIVMTPSQGTNFGLFDLENIQILKGPQGTLFGRNSTGGAFLLTTKRPGVDFGGYGQFEVGNYNLKTFEGAVDLPVNDVVQFRAAGRAVKRDGYQDNVADNPLAGKQKYWDEDSRAMRLTMNMNVGDLSNIAIFSYAENDMAGRIPVIEAYNAGAFLAATIYQNVWNGAAIPPALIDEEVAAQKARDPFDIATDIDSREDVRNVDFANITEFELSDSLTLKNVFGYRKVQAGSANNSDGTALPLLGAPNTTGAAYVDDPSLLETDAEQISEEFQLYGDALDGALEWISGLYLYRMQGTTSGVQMQSGINTDLVNNPAFPFLPVELQALASQGIFQTGGNGDVLNEAQGLFAEGTYTFSDEWALTLGARYSRDEREITVRNFSGLGSTPSNIPGFFSCQIVDEANNPLPNNACERTESETFDSPTFRITGSYTPTEGMLFYAGVATGYRAGGFNLRAASNESFEPYDEETVITYEIGHKADWGLAGFAPVRTNVAVFYQEYDDIQKTQSFVDTNGDFGTRTINAASAVIQGFEAEVTWAMTENLRMDLSYGYTDTYYKEWDLAVIDTGGGVFGPTPSLNAPGTRTIDVSDGDFTYIPTNVVAFSVNYDLPVDIRFGEMSLNLSAYWQSEMKSHPIGNHFASDMVTTQGWTPEQVAIAQSTVDKDAYDVWNARFDWRNIMESNLDAALWVKNLADEEYVVGGLNIIDVVGVSAETYGAPRTFGASVRYNF